MVYVKHILNNINDYYSLCSYAASVITKEIYKYSPEMGKYKEQISKLLIERYQKELKYTPVGLADASDIVDKLIPERLFISINPDNDEVLSVSGINTNYGANRAQMFAAKEVGMENMRQVQSAMFQQLESVFKEPNTFAEVSYKLFEQFEKIYNFYVKINKGKKPFDLYYLPAESVAKIIPNRKMLVSENGVVYRKFVHGANSFASKITISNSPNINGAIGYPTFEEASGAAQYKNKFIRGKYGTIEVLDYTP